MPTRMVSADGSPVLWLPPGAGVMRPGVGGRYVREVSVEEAYTLPLSPIERPWHGGGVLIIGRPGRAHSTWLFWEGETFAGWYVNLEAAWRPSRYGFDTEDHTLDLWIDPDGAWRWKDEDELAVAVELGFHTREQADEFRAEGERVIAEWPFPTGWEDWRPDPSWPATSLPADWED
jgi:uncharacterized protein